MAQRPQADVDAEEEEARQFVRLSKKGRAAAEFVEAVQMARLGRTQAGLDCSYTEDGDAEYTTQQGLKAACHGREDAAATLVLQLKIMQRLDSQRKISLWILAVLALVALQQWM